VLAPLFAPGSKRGQGLSGSEAGPILFLGVLD